MHFNEIEKFGNEQRLYWIEYSLQKRINILIYKIEINK